MQHLVSGGVVQHQADSFGRVQPRWDRNQFMLWQAGEFRVGAVDRQRGNDLARFESSDPVSEPIHHANQIPTWCEGKRRRFGMNALAHHDVGQGNTRGEHSYPHFTMLWLGALFLNEQKFLGPAVVTDDDALVLHGPVPPAPASMSRRG